MIKKIAESIRNNKNILEKKELNPIVRYIDDNSFKSERVFRDIGEDSASIKHKEKLMLVTTDRIKTSFIENFPFGAGFSSILVSVDDIYACGGFPLAASLIISYVDEQKGKKIIEGVCEGSHKFKVPIIRGHTNASGTCYELSSTVIGEIKKDAYISAGNAVSGDNIILALDCNGKVGKASKFYFDTTTFKDSEEVLFKRKAMNRIAEEKLANASKDVSNGGLFGSILQMIKYSEVGADININKIEIPPKLLDLGYDLISFSKMYLTTSFILSAPDDKCRKIIGLFEEHGLNARVIGKVINEKNLLRINDGKDKSIDVIKF